MQEILVVEDDKDMCRIISSILKEEGYKIGRAYGREQAIKKIKAKGYNLMILDYKLPNRNGINLLKEVRRIQPSLKVIMISAYGSPSIKSMAKKFGVYRFLDKPFDLNRLVKVVKDALTKKVRVRFTAPQRDCPRFTDVAKRSRRIGTVPRLKRNLIPRLRSGLALSRVEGLNKKGGEITWQ